MKNYNRKFDSGFTLTTKGMECTKDSPVLEACGSLDELSCFLGVSKSLLVDKELKDTINSIQKDLILIMGDIVSGSEKLSKERVKGLEGLILRYESRVEPAKGWVIPGSSKAEASLQAARAVCRRVERRVLTASRESEVNFEVLRYLNRLSDLLFILAQLEGAE